MSEKRFFFAQDHDCHWYCVPCDRAKEFKVWTEADPEDEGFNPDRFEDCRLPGGPESWSFTDPINEG